MDSLYSTPLFEMFRRGEVAHDIRMLAARGVLAPRAHEQLALLVLLSNDSDGSVRDEAVRTLDRIPAAALSGFLGSPEVPEDVRTFFAARGVFPSGTPSAAAAGPLVAVTDGAADEIAPADEAEQPAGDTAGPEGERRRTATIQRLALLNVTEKVKAAMRGTREERGILIRDSNKLVAIAVLSSPKVTEQEIETFARLGSVSEDVLRVIGTTRAWVKNYGVIRGLCGNPKTPIGLTLGFVKHLLERDIKALATDRNLPDPLKLAARKVLQAGQSRRG